MKKIKSDNKYNKATYIIILFFLSMIFAACAGIDPRRVDVELPTTPPRVNMTSFTETLANLGLMTEIYGTDVLKIQSNPIGDKTGTSQSTGGEIPRDITEMMKSSLNSIGGNVVYIPYDPAFLQNQMVTGYSNFENKMLPNVILSGGITEFDRGLVTKGENTDLSAGAEFTGMYDWLPSKEVQLKHTDAAKEGLARITLDFNLLDFRTMSGLSKMTAVNTMEVHKALGEKELGITLFGPTFGLKGSIKKVQGRHAAVRLLVELSSVQIVGKYLVVPYWRLLGDDAVPDRVVLDTITKHYYSLNEAQRIANLKAWLYLYGHDVPLSGGLDETTRQALQQVDKNYNPSDKSITLDTFQNVYINIPLSHEALKRRKMLVRSYQQQKKAADTEGRDTYTQSRREEQSRSQSLAVRKETPAAEPGKQHPRKKKEIAKILSQDELIEILNELSK